MKRLVTAAIAGAVASVGIVSTALAATYTLDFGYLGYTGIIPDTFGDNADADISYRSIGGSGWGDLPTVDPDGVYAWKDKWGYSNQTGVAWTYGIGEHGEIRIEATNPTDYVALDQFVLADWSDPPSTGTWYAFDLNWNQIGYGSSLVDAGSTWINFWEGNPAAQGGLILQWGDDAEETAIGDIRYFVYADAVPLPATVWLLASGLGGLGFAGWRREPGAAA